MRTLLMAGSALMLMSGVALAQSNNGVTGEQSQGTTINQTSDSATGQMAPKAANGMSGYKAGAGNEAMSSGAARSSAGSMMGTNGTVRNGDMAPMHHTGMMHHSSMNVRHHMMRNHMDHGMMPSDASAGTYLHIAEHAVMSHNRMRAHEALGRAETNLLTGSYIQGSVNGQISTPAISAIRHARTDVEAGQYDDASMMIHKAMMRMHNGMTHQGMMHHSGMMHNSAMEKMQHSSTGMNAPRKTMNESSPGGGMMQKMQHSSTGMDAPANTMTNSTPSANPSMSNPAKDHAGVTMPAPNQ